MLNRVLVSCLFIILVVCLAGTAYSQELAVNGNFETGDFTGWTVVDTGISGNFLVLSGTLMPLSGMTMPAPPEGIYAAVTDQTGPGSHIIYQDIAIPAEGPTSFSATVYVENWSGVYVIGPDLSELSGPNQQMRVDIMDPTAPVDDIGAGVLMNVFRTNVGDPASIPYTLITADLTPFAGQTVRIRIAEVDNQFFFNGAVDAVSVQNISAVPTMNQWGMIIFVLIAGLGALYSLRRRRIMG